MNLNELIKEAHEDAKEKGWYDDGERNIGELLMLIVSELGEALEAHRCGRFAKRETFKISIKENFKLRFEGCIKDTFEDEIADVFIRLADVCGYLGIDIEKYIMAKMEYNKTRPRKHGKAC